MRDRKLEDLVRRETVDIYGTTLARRAEEVALMREPTVCLHCYTIHDVALITMVQRYSDCSVWACPTCHTLIDDRPRAWGGKAVALRSAANF
jgi:cytosine/adenosine deaminase-related metal-dependent hydrolase